MKNVEQNHRRKVLLQQKDSSLSSYSLSSDKSPSERESNHRDLSRSSISQDDDCMNHISQKIRSLEKKLQQQTKKSNSREDILQPILKNKKCSRCEQLEIENSRLREENEELRVQARSKTKAKGGKSRARSKSRAPQAEQIRRLARESKSKLQKEIELLGIVDRLAKRLRTSILRKRQG